MIKTKYTPEKDLSSKKIPKILLLDIETSPALGYVWKKWDTNVIEFKDSWYILS